MPIVKSEELIVRIKDSDFSEFAGYYYTNSDYTENNSNLNAYIKLYKTSENIKYLQIECDRSFSMHTIAYIIDQVDENYFIETDHDMDNVKKNKYWLCFYKGDKKKDG